MCASSLEGNMSWLIILARLVNIIHSGFGVGLPGLLKPVDLGWGDVASSQQLSLCGCDNQPRNKGAILCNAFILLAGASCCMRRCQCSMAIVLACRHSSMCCFGPNPDVSQQTAPGLVPRIQVGEQFAVHKQPYQIHLSFTWV